MTRAVVRSRAVDVVFYYNCVTEAALSLLVKRGTSLDASY